MHFEFAVLGDKKSIKELAQLYQQAYGTEPQVQRLGSLEDLYTKMTAVFKENPANYYAWMGMFYQYYMLNGSTSLDNLDNERYPSVKPITVEDFLKKYGKDTIGQSAQF